MFNLIVEKLQFGIEEKMFGARCIKSSNEEQQHFFGKKIWF